MKRFLILIGCMLSMFLYAENIDYNHMPFSNTPATYQYIPFKTTATLHTYDYTVPALQENGAVTYPYEDATPIACNGPRRSLNFDDDDRGVGELLPVEKGSDTFLFVIALCSLFAVYKKKKNLDKNKI